MKLPLYVIAKQRDGKTLLFEHIEIAWNPPDSPDGFAAGTGEDIGHIAGILIDKTGDTDFRVIQLEIPDDPQPASEPEPAKEAEPLAFADANPAAEMSFEGEIYSQGNNYDDDGTPWMSIDLGREAKGLHIKDGHRVRVTILPETTIPTQRKWHFIVGNSHVTISFVGEKLRIESDFPIVIEPESATSVKIGVKT